MRWLLYGANGYTGRLIAELAETRGDTPVLAGRSADKVVPLARRYGFEHVVVDLADDAALDKVLADVDVVAHVAGPFSATSAPMVDACLRTTTHYLDITGEVAVFEAIFARDADAKKAGVVLLPGAGFDVVPTDCAAAMVAGRLPDAVSLDLAFTMGGGISQGTLKTAFEGAGHGGVARVDGALRKVPVGHRLITADFPSGRRTVASIPWGDLASAYWSTKIPNITTYTVVPGARVLGRVMGAGQRVLGPVLRTAAVQRLGKTAIERLAPGPNTGRRENSRAEVWGRARAADGGEVTATLVTPNGYSLTADSVLRAVRRLGAGEVEPGSHTPSSAFGADYVSTLDGVVVGEIVSG